jgi:hypothetical protein
MVETMKASATNSRSFLPARNGGRDRSLCSPCGTGGKNPGNCHRQVSVLSVVYCLAAGSAGAATFFDPVSTSLSPSGFNASAEAQVIAGSNGSVAWAVSYNPDLTLTSGGTTTVFGNGQDGLWVGSNLDPDFPRFDSGTTVVIGNGPGGQVNSPANLDGGVNYFVSFNPSLPLAGTGTTMVIGNGGCGSAQVPPTAHPPEPGPGAGDSQSVASGTDGAAVRPDLAEGPAAEASLGPRIAMANADILNTFLVGATVADGGYGYTQPPAVKVVGGGGHGAEVMAEVSNGVVTGFTVTDPGSGYTRKPTLFVAPPSSATKAAIAISGSGRVAVVQNLIPGRNYRLLSSRDLQSWTPVGEPFAADSELTSTEFSTAKMSQFYALEEIP